MKNFFKMVLASFVGMTIASAVGLFCLFMLIGIVSSSISSLTATTDAVKLKVKPNSILRIMLDQPITERSQSDFSSSLSSRSLSVTHNTGLNDILKAIDRAADDPNITLIYLDLSAFSAGLAHTEEIRNALDRFKESGKPIVAYGDNYSQLAFYLATVADRVYLNPFGSASLSGLGAEVMFYKGLLDKLKIEMQVIRHGKFKSAVEPFTADRMSAENREQYLSFINAIWGHITDRIATARQIEPARLQQLVNTLGLESAQQSLENGMVDKLLYKDELLGILCELTGVTSDENLLMVDVSDYGFSPYKQAIGRDKIAVVYADGEIKMGKSEKNITAWNYANILRQIRHDGTVKAVVFRVNSPGGSAQASEIIARELSLLQAEKPVVVSMSNYAASGGYWIAMPSDKIIVNPLSLTGSIGVFGLLPNFKRTMNDHLGITTDVVQSNTSADYPSVTRPLTAHERRTMQESVEFVYTQFVAKVSESRELSPERVDELGQGRVWSGIDAVRLGLADELGGLTEAIAAAAGLAELDLYRTVEYPAIGNPFEQLLRSLMKGEASIKTPLPDEISALEHLYNNINKPGVYARLPYELSIEN
ncbi:MAG: signal peptide peptidase SppA [Prevotellaceae bacterium]|jgi:protease-4|nr:signal peptide peptidase SppA [Prevotellaceae bacterium]